MKKFALAVVLMCALSTSMFAGDVPTTGKAEPTPTPATSSISTSSTSGTLLVTVILTILSLR